MLVFGDTLRRLLMFRGTRVAFKRRGFQKDVKAIAAASAEMVYTAMEKIIGHANAEELANNQHVPKELQTALRQMLISTKDVSFTDGYKRSHRHEGHNLNVTHGSLVVFATFNFADNYSPVLVQPTKLCLEDRSLVVFQPTKLCHRRSVLACSGKHVARKLKPCLACQVDL